jgi:subtilisin-like proprotein convertase family protein
MRAALAIAAAALAMSSSGCAAYNGIFGVCEGLSFSQQVNQSIPDNNDTGITSMISLPVNGLPNGIGLQLNIDHELDSDLQIRMSHNSTIIEIDDLGDHGPFHEFDNTDAGGVWIVNVADTLSADTGFWTDWEITICGE